jgi:hypothetical protein
MSAIVQLSSKLPGDEDFNGVDAIALDLLKDPDTIRVGVVFYDVSKITRQVDAGTDVPTIRVRKIEPISTVSDVPDAIRALVDAAIEQRTGRKPLPLDQVEPLDFGGDAE